MVPKGAGKGSTTMRFTEAEPSLFSDLTSGEKVSVESSEFYHLILHIDNKSYYFHESGDLDGTSIYYDPKPGAIGNNFSPISNMA